ncbi:hypothetical protein [Flavobacterium rhizosphaerae]|uniref:Uncharacterized protein n=1 Tax=Flavobacterium rhizosphaerae TaxID=3163298 RepID=A0ABW8YYV4_9FLAO
MNKILTLFLMGLLAVSCNDDEPGISDPNPVTGNKVLMLKVDYQTYAFEEGTQLEFEEATNFTVGVDYHPPGDFGSVALYYSETGQKLFEGGIVWMGLGDMTYPQELNDASAFVTMNGEVSEPEFEPVNYNEEEAAPMTEDADFTAIWNAVNNLQLVNDYRAANPNATVKVFLYTPSVGVGNPADWDYFVFIKN